MGVLAQKAEQASESMGVMSGGPVGFDWISLILPILTAIFQMLGGCNTAAAKAGDVVRSPGLLHRLRLRRLVAESPCPKQHRDELLNSLLDTGFTFTDEECKKAMTEARK